MFTRNRPTQSELPTEQVKFRWDSSSTLFAALLLTCIGISIALTPPFQVPDAPVHFMKAASLSFGDISPIIRAKQAGYPMPESLTQFLQLFNNIPFHVNIKATASEFQSALKLSWHAHSIFTTFTPASFDPPFLYIPDVIGIWIGRILNLSILTSYYLAEIVTAVACVALLSSAFTLSKARARILIITLSFLPMSISLFASVSRDALLVPLVTFAVVFSRSAFDRPGLSRWKTWSIRIIPTLLIVPVAMTKPPYVAILIAVDLNRQLGPNRISNIWKRFAPFIIGLVTTGIWYIFASSALSTTISGIPGISPKNQIRLILTQPFTFVHTVVHTIRVDWEFYYHSTIGNLGWLDTTLPNWTFILLGVFLLCGIGLLFLGFEPEIENLAPLLRVVVSFVMGAVGTEAALYVTWTKLGATVIQGVQGRYFLPLMPLFLLIPQRQILPRFLEQTRAYTKQLPTAYLATVTAVSTFSTVAALLSRFWLS